MPTLQPKTKPKVIGNNSAQQLQRIHYKSVPDPKNLLQLLEESYGPGNYTVEVSIFHQVGLYLGNGLPISHLDEAQCVQCSSSRTTEMGKFRLSVTYHSRDILTLTSSNEGQRFLVQHWGVSYVACYRHEYIELDEFRCHQVVRGSLKDNCEIVLIGYYKDFGFWAGHISTLFESNCKMEAVFV